MSTLIFKMRIESDEAADSLLQRLIFILKKYTNDTKSVVTFDGRIEGGGFIEATVIRSFASELFVSIDELHLATRVRNALWRSGVFSIGDLVLLTKDEVLAIELVGDKTLEVIERALAEKGMYLAGSED